MIKRSITLISLLIAFGVGNVLATPHEQLKPLPKHSLSTVLITKFIEQYHYKKTPLNDAQSGQILDEYIKTLDPNRSIFTQHDINQFDRFKTVLDDSLRKGDLEPAFIIFRQFNERRIERAKFALQRLDQGFDFSIKESYTFDRTEAQWPKDKKALDDIWRKRVKNDYLTLLLAKKEEKELKKTLRKRYERLITRSDQFKAEDAYEFFINAYLRNLEPHTAYFSPRTSENFNINMSLSLEGIGAVLQTIDEHTVVKKVIPGGPADMSGLLHAEDRIVGVGQGTEGDVVDVIGWRLDDVVDRIRGPKDSIVQLHVLPKDSGLDGPDKYITIVRNKIKLEEQQAQKSIIEIPDGDKSKRVGVIEIPTFYMDFAASARGDDDYSSTTRDTKKLIDELRAENVDGIVVDLRSNGGGSLVEAVSLTGLFIKSGPVVQIRESSGEVQLNEDDDESVAYSGPLAVLVDRHSASASEIFAGAIQDYGRGTIIGEPTFGKGTVQTIVDLNRYARGSDVTLGKLKMTMAQFFRVNGDSTQHRGVVPDIVFPTAVESDDQGERSLENALPWARIAAAGFTPNNRTPFNIDIVKQNHKSRVESDSGFKFLLAQAEVRKEVLDKKEISLLMSERKKEREMREEARHERLNTFRVSRGIEPVSLEEDIVDDEDRDEAKSENLNDELQQIELREAAAILVDLIKVPGKGKLSQNTMSKAVSNKL